MMMVPKAICPRLDSVLLGFPVGVAVIQALGRRISMGYQANVDRQGSGHRGMEWHYLIACFIQSPRILEGIRLSAAVVRNRFLAFRQLPEASLPLWTRGYFHEMGL